MPTESEAQVEPASWWEDPIDILLSPIALFRRRREAPLGPPLAMLLGAAMLAYVLMIPVTDLVVQATMAENPEAAAAMERFGTLFRVIGAVFAPIGMFFVLAWAALLLLAFGRLFDLPTTFGRTLLIATYAGWLLLIAQILGGLIIMLQGGEAAGDLLSALSFGVLRVTGTEGIPRPILPLLGRLDVFAIWQAVLWGIGISVFYAASRGRAAVIAATTWVCAALPEILMAALRPGP